MNEQINLSNIKVVRPSKGLHPKYFFKILGKKVKKNLYKGDRLNLRDLK